ncbi:zinc finger transcription factor ace1 like protein [Zymoseptoria brevis]|uniref:Zinc finger transcription factor ace1 like protein n=1 Tax=Zymoseptoria brevis TaxID=1047168 RepID=A0A0F4G9Y4_9PEZI|nr:zinc finger transcription factor ace1 like protein [Zymoseptoria brevis]
MSSAATHPRRRAARTSNDSTPTPSLVDSFQNMSIRKGDTFHPQTNTSQSSFWDPLESRARTPSMPSRSATSPQSLEDLLVGSGERRVAELFEKVDRAIAANSRIALGNVLSEPEVLPLPNFAVGEAEATGTPLARRHSHTSDSGLGSSVADSVDSTSSGKGSTESAHTVTAARQSPASRSLSEISDACEEERGLSKYAAEQIHKYIIKPILREDSLKEFHELIKTVPERIGDKEIKNLRDLEKTLIFLAPDYSRSPSKYLRFCERTIRVLHTTVTTLHESDQRAPTDRPYTQGYFFDLVEQIRRYAAILAITREKQAKGEKLDAMDITENEQVSLHGGPAHNGKPAELIRITADGKKVSLASGEVLSETEVAAASMKRPAVPAEDDEEAAMRSMARRKKNAKPEIHTCELCDKEFKRPCDLTKHVKTHERPWKCSAEDCKYHEYGWPTEKERDRHVNDKHSSTPSLYHCLFKPCPYTSKRESNCKQHMEKAHNWVYVRSKNNGKARTSVTRLPQGSVPQSPASVALTPLAPSPSVQSWSNSSRHSSLAPPGSMDGSNYGTPAFGTPFFMQPSPEFQQHFNYNPKAFDFNDLGNFPDIPVTPAMSEESHPSTTFSSSSGLMFTGSAFDDASPKDLAFDTFGDYSFDMPDTTQHHYAPNSVEAGSGNTVAAMHISPGAQLHQTFTADPMSVDGMSHSDDFSSGPSGDFTLYGGTDGNGASGDMFQPLGEQSSWGNVNSLGSNFGAHLDSTNPPALQSADSMLDDLFPGMADPKPNSSFYNGYL